MRPQLHLRRQGGFTLAEIIIVLVVTGILSGIVAVFIRTPVLNYVNGRAKALLSDSADIALRRMRRDVRLSLPNSLRRSSDGRSLEFILTKTGGRYLSAADGQAPALNRQVLSFVSNSLVFDVVGTMPTLQQAIVANDKIVVYNLGEGFTPADAYTGGNIATVQGVAGNRITLTSNPFALQSTPMESPTRRFQVISGPVTYYCNSYALGGDGTVRRYSGYALSQNQPTAVEMGSTNYNVLVSNVQSCGFTYNTTINEPKALAGMTLVLRDPSDSTVTASLSLHVHVDNTP
jgi:MSHA biogenesis protein MshO